MTNLVEMTAAAFAADGPLETAMRAHGLPFVRQDPQTNYANRVAKTFAVPPRERGLVTLLDAETGIGKSLGYLIPMGLAIANGDGRGIISTFTLLLQRQILDEDFPIAAEVVQKMTGRVLRAAPRMGLRNFIAPSRVMALKAALEAEHSLTEQTETVLLSLAGWSDDGTFRSWIEENGPLPPEIRESDICLLTSQGEDSITFKAHLDKTKDADIVIVTHAMMARNLLYWNSMLGTADVKPFAIGVIDEADRMPSVAAEVFSMKLSLPTLTATARSVPGKAGQQMTDVIEAARDWFRGLEKENLRSVDRGASIINLSQASAADLRFEAQTHAAMLAQFCANVAKSRPDEDAVVLKAHAYELEQFVGCCENPSNEQVPFLHWSPVRAYPGFSVVPLNPGRLCNRLWSSKKGAPPFLRALVMTSATLDAVESPLQFQQFRREIGLLGDNFAADLSGSFSPKKFGTMRFVLPDPNATRPNASCLSEEDADDETIWPSNPDWLAYAAQGIEAAASRGGRCLVLTTSFKDTVSLAALLRDHGLQPIEHQRGQRLAECINTLKADPAGLLLSPSAWEGVNLPGLLSHLVIPRLPFAPVDSSAKQARVDSLKASGFAQKNASAIAYRASIYATHRKFRQGIGRAIRTATDDVTVWILDPRFLPPQSVCDRYNVARGGNRFPGFDLCISPRFRTGIRSAFNGAEIFIAKKTGKNLAKVA